MPPSDDQPGDNPNMIQADGPAVLSIGVFDGVHLGHRALIERARSLADRHGLGTRVVALAFDPSPRAVLSPGSEPPRLTEFEHRADLLLEAGADEVLRLEPAPELLGLSPERFVDEVLGPLCPIAVVEGPDFRFGARRAGDTCTLAALGDDRGFAVEVVPPVEVSLNDQSVVAASSSLARWLLAHGRVADAGRVLGRAYELRGRVAMGDRRGRTIGFPTANLACGTMLPGDGVYACVASLENARTLPCAVNVGSRPTFNGLERRVEAHLIGYECGAEEPEYGWPLEIRFVSRLRDQVRFSGIDGLVGQLRRDVARTLEALNTTSPAWAYEEQRA